MYTSAGGRAEKAPCTVVSEARFRHFPAEIEVADWSLSRASKPVPGGRASEKNFEKHF